MNDPTPPSSASAPVQRGASTQPDSRQTGTPAPDPGTQAGNSQALAQTRTVVSSKWSIKMIVIMLVMMMLGVWGVVDAVWVYPKRGARAAEFHEFQHLTAQKTANRLTNDQASVKQASQVLATLREQDRNNAQLSQAQRATLDWLTQLKLIGQLNDTNTSYPRDDFRVEAGKPVGVGSADDRLAALTTKYTTPEPGSTKPPPPPSPLSWYDIPSQWLIAAVGAGVGSYLVYLLLRVRRKTFGWHNATKTLTLPNGATLTPDDIQEFDKTKWDKLFIHLHIRPEHATLGGSVVELDLLRYVPLEEWVLEMERVKEAKTKHQ